MAQPNHIWKDSRTELGLVGRFWGSVYPEACRCGALRKADGTIVEPEPGRACVALQRKIHVDAGGHDAG